MRGVVLFAALLLYAAPSVAQIGEIPVGAQGSPAADIGYFQIVRPVTKGVWLLTEPKFQLQPIGDVTVIEQRDGLVLVELSGSEFTALKSISLPSE